MGFIYSLVYIILSFLTGIILIFISTKTILLSQIDKILTQIYTLPNYQILTGLVGLLIILICIRYLQRLSTGLRREKKISFQAKEGEVSITLYAVENMIKKILKEFKELKDVRPQVLKTKKGISIIVRIVSTSATNIPQLSSRIQNTLRYNFRHTLGIEEELNVKVEIRKILYEENKASVEETKDIQEPDIPYRKYR